MVSVVHSVATQSDAQKFLPVLGEGLSGDEFARVSAAVDFAGGIYQAHVLGSGEGVWSHALGIALIIAGLKLDSDARIAALLFAVPSHDEHGLAKIESQFGGVVARLVAGLSRLNRLRPMTRDAAVAEAKSPEEVKAQIEVLRKMLLAMVEDIRVVLLRLASRTQTLRYYTSNPNETRVPVARETLAIYSPLANRLGVWELKWELEDLSFRMIHPDIYRNIARQLDEKRTEREQFISDAVSRLRTELAASGVQGAEVYGRPKHIYSIWSKMHKKRVDFSEVYDVRALRVIVEDVKDCYTALGLVHNLWTPIPKEFDDYISKPKGNYYRSLHTAVHCPDGRSLEVQIRTREMHQHAELGVAAHWRYKEGSKKSDEDDYDEKIAGLRQLLSWKDEVVDASDWVAHYKKAALDETIYVLTPEGRVLDLPRGATPVDFAYRLHTALGHRCRGAKVDRVLVSLNTVLSTGQCVEILTAKEGGPSRDWLNPELGYLMTQRARSKVRAWFANLAFEQTLVDGRMLVMKELQRLGQGGVNIEQLATKLGFAKAEALFMAAGRSELNMRQLQAMVRGTADIAEERPELEVRRSQVSAGDQGILIVGVGKLLTQLARCCKPAPPDAIQGFITRGKGVSIHRAECSNFAHLQALHPERVIETAWGNAQDRRFPVGIVVDAEDRQGLLRDISDIFAREKLNVVAVQTSSRQGKAHMCFTIEISGVQQLDRALLQVGQVPGVMAVRRD